jgi:hypothetical protein
MSAGASSHRIVLQLILLPPLHLVKARVELQRLRQHRPLWLAGNNLLIAELTRRVCGVFTDDQIGKEIAGWRGCESELAAVANDLKAYDALRGGD